MICRRCGKDIMDGSDNCPVCGVSQHTYITPRNYNTMLTAPTKRTRRGTVMSVVALVVALAGVLAMYFIAGQNSEETDYQKVVDAYTERDVTKCGLALGAFLKKHPNSEYTDDAEELFDRLNSAAEWLKKYDIEPTTEKIDDALEMIDAGDQEQAELFERAQRELIESLKRTARTDVLRVESLELQEPIMGGLCNVIIEWRNMSREDEIREILFRIEAYDETGRPVDASAAGKSEVALTEKKFSEFNGDAGAPYSSFWMNVWQDGQIDHLKITGVKISYMGGGSLSLPPEICETIMG